MGYLDDAIREHLELKRRRGATRDELERAESEAFGPIGAGSAPDDELEAGSDDPYDLGSFGASEHGGSDDVDAGSHDAGDRGPSRDEGSREPHEDAYAPPEDEASPHGDPFRDAPEVEPPSTLAEPIDPDDPVDQPTRAYSLEELDAALAPEGADEHTEEPRRDEPPREDTGEVRRAWKEEGEPRDAGAAEREDASDELEETPDFLQETPEHDRLWFEQKPPKDFDF